MECEHEDTLALLSASTDYYKLFQYRPTLPVTNYSISTQANFVRLKK